MPMPLPEHTTAHSATPGQHHPATPVLSLWWWRRHCSSLQPWGQHYTTVAGWEARYWQQQTAACRTYDVASCSLKVFLLLGNIRRSLGHGDTHAAVFAAGAAVLVMMSVAFMLLCQAQYSRYRRLVLWSHLVAISIMMATSMPQFLSASTSSLMAHRMLVLLFKMGVTWPIMAALMHRLPWQDLAVLCSAFCTYLCCTWAQPLCSHLHRSAEDAELVRSLAAALDTLTGLGMETAAAGVGHASAIPALGSSRTGPNTSYSTYSINSTSRHEQLLTDPGRVSWAPLAQHIAAACVTGTAAAGADGASSLAHAYSGHAVLSGGDCQALLMGQCSAVVTTLTAWVGVLVILFFVVLSEQHSKWRWWHSAAARWQGRPPHEYEATSGWGYVGLRLLYLHILLDLPLMLLWVASSSWYRQPTAALGDYNLF